MKSILLAAVAAIALMPCVASAGKICFDNRRVVDVQTGYVDRWGMGPDGGDAVYFTLDNGLLLPLNVYYNLDSPRGQALHRVLLMAMAGNYRVTGIDHYGDNCDDVDEIHIRR